MSIIAEIRDEIKAVYKEPSSRDLTLLAFLFLGVCSLVGAYQLLWKGSGSGYYWIGVGIALCLSRLIPPLFRRLYRLWVSFAVVLGYFVSRAILLIVFYLVLVPTGLIMRTVGRDPMERKWDPQAQSYWINKEPEEDSSIERYQKQF